MRTTLLRFVLLCAIMVSSMPTYAQRYICLKDTTTAKPADFHDTANLRLYGSSTLDSATLKVRVDKMNDVARSNQKNQKGKVKVGSVFSVCNNSDLSNLSKVIFVDSAGETRSNVDNIGVEISVHYSTEINGKEYLIPYDKVIPLEQKPKERTLYKELFTYASSENNVYIQKDKLNSGFKLVINNSKEKILTKENPVIYDVDMEAELRLITSSVNDFYFDEVFSPKDLEEYSGDNDDSGIISFIKKHVVALLIALAVLGVLFVLFFILWIVNKKRYGKYKCKKEGETPSQYPPVQEPGMVSYDDIKNMTEVYKQFKNKVEETTSGINKIEEYLYKWRNYDDLNKVFETQKEELKNVKEEKDSLNKQLEQLKNDKEQLEKEDELESGTLKISECKEFVQTAKNILSSCISGEKIINKYISNLSGDDQKKMSCFLAQYTNEMPVDVRDKWNSVLSTLSIKGYINDKECTKFLQNEKDQIGWLKKHFIEEMLQHYVSPLLIMLEQIRCANEYEISRPKVLSYFGYANDGTWTQNENEWTNGDKKCVFHDSSFACTDSSVGANVSSQGSLGMFNVTVGSNIDADFECLIGNIGGTLNAVCGSYHE